MTPPTHHALDHAFQVRCDLAALHEYLLEVLRPLATTDRNGPVTTYRLEVAKGAPFRLHSDNDELVASAFPSRPVAHLLNQINTRAIRATGSSWTLLHAGAVAVGPRAVVLPAAMEAGKSTLVAGLVRSGATYLSDEIAAISPKTGRLRPYPRSLSLDPGSWHLFPECRPDTLPEIRRFLPDQWQVQLTNVGTRTCMADIALVVHHRYEAGASTVTRTLEPVEAVRMMLETCFTLHDHPDRDLNVLGWTGERCPHVEVVSGNLDEAIRTVQDVAFALADLDWDPCPTS